MSAVLLASATALLAGVPTIPVIITSIVPAPGGYNINYTGGGGYQFILLTSPTVTAHMSTWTPIKTNTATPGSFFVSPTANTFYGIQSR